MLPLLQMGSFKVLTTFLQQIQNSRQLLVFPSMFLAVFPHPAFSSSPDSLRILQWNAEGLRIRSAELLHFILSHAMDLICIHESNHNSSSSFRIPGFSALRSDCAHTRSGIFSPDDPHASGGVNIFVRQGLSFSEISTSPLSSLDRYSNYLEVNTVSNNSFSLSFLNVYAPQLALLRRISEPTPFPLSYHFLQKSLYSGGLQLPSPLLRLKRYF